MNKPFSIQLATGDQVFALSTVATSGDKNTELLLSAISLSSLICMHQSQQEEKLLVSTLQKRQHESHHLLQEVSSSYTDTHLELWLFVKQKIWNLT